MQIDLTYLRKLVMLLSKWGLRGLLHENSQKIDKMCLVGLIILTKLLKMTLLIMHGEKTLMLHKIK